MSALAKSRLAERLMKQCSCDTKVKPLTYILDLTPDKSGKKQSMIEKYTFGSEPETQMTHRVLLLVGATGAGKTTLINGMVNYIFGVRWEDKFRFKMVVENAVTQAESVTQKITAYTIYHQEGSPIKFSLTIVDIPSFGNTQIPESDEWIISQIKDLFSLSPPEGGVDHLDAIGFVIQAPLARLTPMHRYIFDSIISVFGKDVGSNVLMMTTFADGKKPPVVDAIKAANISFRKFFKFNNTAIYPFPEQKHPDASGEEDEGENFGHMFWYMGMQFFDIFLGHFKSVEPVDGVYPLSFPPPLVKPRLAEIVMKQCSCDTTVKPLTYILQLTRERGIRGLSMNEKYTFGPKSKQKERVLLLVGATGAGKTTLINGMINYLLGVRWGDKFRFKMVVEDAVSQDVSRTKKITAYTIYHQEGSPIDYTLTIVDTPGFGSTGGLERNKWIISQIKNFFSSEGGVDCLHAIGIVTHASLARLTPKQRHIFDSILSVFGKDVADNIFMMITFADGPPVVDALKAANIPFRRFTFNNFALYPHSEQKHMDAFDSSGEEDGGGDFSHMFWDMGMKSFENFFTHFKVVYARSLELTKEVLRERQRLETTINSLQPLINEGLAKIEEVRHEEQILKQHKSDMSTNKNFTYTVTVTKQRKVDLSPGHYVMNCLTCNYTCHDDCPFDKNEDLWRCRAMNGGDINTARCTVCPNHCHWRQHVNNPYRFEIYQEEEIRTANDLKRKYVEAVAGKTQVQHMIKAINDRFSQLDGQIMETIDQVRDSTKRLGEIALKPNPLTEVEYIDLLIESEKQEAKPGYQERIKYYQDVRKRAQLATGVLGIPTPAGRRGSEAHTSLWTSIRKIMENS